MALTDYEVTKAYKKKAGQPLPTFDLDEEQYAAAIKQAKRYLAGTRKTRVTTKELTNTTKLDGII